MQALNRHQHPRPLFAYVQLLILLNFLFLPTTLAQYSSCSESCIEAQDTAFNIPDGAIYGAVANNRAVCNNEAFLKAAAQCIYQNCGQQDLSVTVGLFISACITTDTPTSYTAQQLIAFGSEGAASASSVAGTTSEVPLQSTASVPETVFVTTASPSVVTVGSSGTAFVVSTVSNLVPSVITVSASPTGASPANVSNTSASSSSKRKLSGGAIAGIIIGVLIILALVALFIFLLLRNNRGQTPEVPSSTVIVDSGTTARHEKAEIGSGSKPVGVVSYIPYSSHENSTVAPLSKTPTKPGASEMSANNATMQEAQPISPASIPAELDQHPNNSVTQPPYLSASVTRQYEELPAYYVPRFEMATDNSTTIHENSQTPSSTGGAPSNAASAGVGVMRAPDEELAMLEAEEEKIRKRKSELLGTGGQSS